MSGTYQVVMGDRGRLVLPAALRHRLGLRSGAQLALLDTPQGMVLATREQLKALVRVQLAGKDLVGGLLAERREQARQEDSG